MISHWRSIRRKASSGGSIAVALESDWIECSCGKRFEGERCIEQFRDHIESAVALDEDGQHRMEDRRFAPDPTERPPEAVLGMMGEDPDDDDDEPEMRFG